MEEKQFEAKCPYCNKIFRSYSERQLKFNFMTHTASCESEYNRKNEKQEEK